MRIPRLLLIVVLFLTFILISCGENYSPIKPGGVTEDKDTKSNVISVRQPCLQIGFGASIQPEILRAVNDKGWTVARMDNSRGVSAHETMQQMREFESAGFKPYVIVANAHELSQLPEGYDYELRNEPDLEGPSPDEYKALMWDAAAVAKERNQRLFVGVVSNLNTRGFNYLNAIMPFPEHVGVAVHRYGDGSFDKPHAPYHSRVGEARALRNLIGASRPFVVSEFGYPTRTRKDKYLFIDLGLTNAEAVYRIKQEYLFWEEQGAEFACLYQINDGNTADGKNKFGIRDMHGDWKDSAYIFKGEQE